MSNHTPGPWAIFNDHPDEGTAKLLSSIRPVHHKSPFFSDIATVYRCDVPEQRANAKLIAAAPKLLEALQELERSISALHAHDLGVTVRPELQDLSKQIQASRAVVIEATRP